jgi:RNA polymerase sigma factor (sigma-70 family)
VFIILAQKAGRIAPKTILSGWLYQTARLTACSFLKSEARRARREQEAYMQTEPGTTALDETWTQLAPLLEDAMGQLGEKERDMVVLRFFGNKSFPEMATASGLSENAAQKRVHGALEKLHRYFAKRGVSSTTAIIADALGANSVHAAPAGLAKSVAAIAITKGAAAGTSTLTLIKGALKLMAWTKAKMAVVTSTALLLATVTTVIVANHFHHIPPAQTGRLKLPTGNGTPMIGYSYSHFGVIVASDGSLWSWGEERLGWPVLGLKNFKNTVSLRRIGNENDWASVSAADSGCLAIKSDGTLWAWGENHHYQLVQCRRKDFTNIGCLCQTW